METRSKRKPKFNITEKKLSQQNNITYEELLKNVSNSYETLNEERYGDDFAALNLHYSENYYKRDLELILGYYNISKRKKNKGDMVNEIVIFELDSENDEIVSRRKLMWFYIEEISTDSYLNKFLILD